MKPIHGTNTATKVKIWVRRTPALGAEIAV
jgi:hypothetical protein